MAEPKDKTELEDTTELKDMFESKDRNYTVISSKQLDRARRWVEPRNDPNIDWGLGNWEMSQREWGG
ncbi:unnamed protein product [Fusarium equiseti]|uniref:Uncharacterized protein n=1 Tax=Fusarium equiseti TaxID=61235 RepID=A0A8J2J601_FUSEQ|nr:unnamed protein product [Fusarium equiseti]